MRISEVGKETNLSSDTLRYYEKIGLLVDIHRDESGRRAYSKADLSKLHFIQRAKAMNFSLDEIAQLLEMRKNPQGAKQSVRELTLKKKHEVEQHLALLNSLHKELTLLTNLCQGAGDDCPIIEDLNQP